MSLTKLANKFSAWLAGFEHGEYDCKMQQWGDPRSSWGAWRKYMKEHNTWHESLDKSYPEYQSGYSKALILNKGQGITRDPDDKEIWEDAHHPWGYNRSRIDLEHRRKLDESEPVPNAKDRLKNL
jgi:hypothetical protein